MLARKIMLSAFVIAALVLTVAAQAPTAESGGFENEQVSSEGANTYRIRRSWTLATPGRTFIATGVRVKRVRPI